MSWSVRGLLIAILKAKISKQPTVVERITINLQDSSTVYYVHLAYKCTALRLQCFVSLLNSSVCDILL